jgi:hypothetical protein
MGIWRLLEDSVSGERACVTYSIVLFCVLAYVSAGSALRGGDAQALEQAQLQEHGMYQMPESRVSGEADSYVVSIILRVVILRVVKGF